MPSWPAWGLRPRGVRSRCRRSRWSPSGVETSPVQLARLRWAQPGGRTERCQSGRREAAPSEVGNNELGPRPEHWLSAVEVGCRAEEVWLPVFWPIASRCRAGKQ